MGPAVDADHAWADAVFVSGMHIQAPQIRSVAARAHAFGRPAALGGSSVSATPDAYPAFDYLHVGEIGDATDRLIARLDADCARPPGQVVLEARERLGLVDFPRPAFDAVPMSRHLLGSVQFSSDRPYRCEFCDTPALYGRRPCLESPGQLFAELDLLVAEPAHPAVVYHLIRFTRDALAGRHTASFYDAEARGDAGAGERRLSA